MYNGNPYDTVTFGVGATVVSSTAASEHVIHSIVKGVFENFDSFKKLHPAFANLKKEEMISVIYSLLCMFLGNPPIKFDWSIKDKNNKFTRFNNIDPLDFYRKFTKVKLNNKVCLSCN